MRTFLTVAAAAVAAAVIGAATVVAGHQATTSYTGCLNVASGTISKLALGDAPQSGCGESQLEIHLSSGDVTSVTAGIGLEGGGTEGAVSVGISDSYRLPQTCTNDQVTKWTGTSWTCGSDNDTTYSAGAGLSLSGTTFSADTSAMQARVGSSCAAGSSIRVIGSDGSVTCEPDDDTTYSGANFATSNQDCPASQFANGINSSGALRCGVPAKGSLSVVRVSGPETTMCSTLDPSEGCSSAGYSAAQCPSATVDVTTGGGFQISGDVRVVYSRPLLNNGWEVFGINESAVAGGSVRAIVVCLRLS
jgi:hypothetical protein